MGARQTANRDANATEGVFLPNGREAGRDRRARGCRSRSRTPAPGRAAGASDQTQWSADVIGLTGESPRHGRFPHAKPAPPAALRPPQVNALSVEGEPTRSRTG
jgi:hypothetical protein